MSHTAKYLRYTSIGKKKLFSWIVSWAHRWPMAKKKVNWGHHLTGKDSFAVCPNGKAYEQRLKLYHVLVVMHTAKMYNLPCVLLLTCVFYFST